MSTQAKGEANLEIEKFKSLIKVKLPYAIRDVFLPQLALRLPFCKPFTQWLSSPGVAMLSSWGLSTFAREKSLPQRCSRNGEARRYLSMFEHKIRKALRKEPASSGLFPCYILKMRKRFFLYQAERENGVEMRERARRAEEAEAKMVCCLPP